MGTNELQVIEFEVKELTPAKITSNAEELKKFMIAVKDKYKGWIVTEEDIEIAKTERTKLNKLEKKISDERKRIQKEANADIEVLINNLKTYEKEVKDISNFIGNQLIKYDEEIKEAKKDEISEIIDNVFRENVELKLFLSINEKWLNKTFSLKKIEEEIEMQFDALNKKQKFILGQLEVVNEEIENKIIFNDIQYLMNAEFDEVMKTLINKKNEIKATEENIRKRAEEEKIRALEELEAKKEIEKQQAIEKAQNKPVQEENRNAQENVSEVKKSCENVKYFNTTIRFEKAPLTFLKELKILSDRYQIKYELKENIEL